MQLFEDIHTRRYDFGEIMRGTLRGTFGPRFLEFFVPAALVAAISFGLYFYTSMLTFDLMAESISDVQESEVWGESDAEESDDDELTDAERRALLRMGGVFLRALPVALLIFFLCIVATQIVLLRMRSYVTGEDEPFADAVSQSLQPPTVLAYVVTGIVAYLGLALGSMLCIVPGLLLGLVFAFLPACITFGEPRFRVPIAEPFELLKGAFWKSIGVIAALGFIMYLLQQVLSVPLLAAFWNPEVFVEMDEETDPEAMLDWMRSFWTSPLLYISIIGMFVLQTVHAVVTGMATVIMYVNYRATPFLEPGVPQSLPTEPVAPPTEPVAPPAEPPAAEPPASPAEPPPQGG